MAQPPKPLEPSRFAGSVGGKPVSLITLEGGAGVSISICTLGARWLQALIPNASGLAIDAVLGADSLDGVRDGVLSMGCVIGRYANRIRHAQFSLNGRQWHLPANEGAHCLHGGLGGTRHQVFDVMDQKPHSVTLAHRFLSAVDGFPGDLDFRVTYSIEAPQTIRIRFEASALDVDTVGSFTSHAFFNLDGAGSGVVDGHRLCVSAPAVLALDGERLPTGAVVPVAGTRFDLQTTEVLARHAGWPDGRGGVGFDAPWVWPERAESPRLQATLIGATSGLAMSVYSPAPSLQVYTGGALDGSLPKHAGKAGQVYGPRAGICLEPQGYPDAPNHAHFPSSVIRAGETFIDEVTYAFHWI